MIRAETISYRSAAEKALNWVEARLQEDGSFQGFPKDIACYYKAPTLFTLFGKENLAHRIINYIQSEFMDANGDFVSSKGFKSANPAFVEFWVYTNGWVVTAAERLNRSDLSSLGWEYFKNYETPKDILSSAHMGLAALTMNEMALAKECGSFLEKMSVLQDPSSSKFYLRMDRDGNLVKDMPVEMAIFEHVDQEKPNQAYFMVGYPLAYLVKLYQATRELHYLQTAEKYFQWIVRCTGNLRSFFFAHKVGWAASCYARVVQDSQAARLAKSIADYLVSIQEEDGSFLSSTDPLTHIDQTVEIAIWLHEIADNLGE